MDISEALRYLRCPKCEYNKLEQYDSRFIVCPKCIAKYSVSDNRIIDFIGNKDIKWVKLFEKYPGIYDYWVSAGWFLLTLNRYSRLIDALIKDISCGVFLDVGTGTGLVARRLEDVCGDSVIFGVDISMSMLKYAVSKTRKTIFIRSFMEKLPFKNDVSDYYFANMTIHMSSSLRSTLAEAVRVIRKGSEMRFTAVTNDTLRGKIFTHIFHVNKLSYRSYIDELYNIGIKNTTYDKVGFVYLFKVIK